MKNKKTVIITCLAVVIVAIVFVVQFSVSSTLASPEGYSKGSVGEVLRAPTPTTTTFTPTPTPTVTTTSVIVSISTPAQAAAGSAIDVNVNIGQVTNLVAYQFDLAYDNSIVQLISDEGGPGVTSGMVGSSVMPLDNWAFCPTGLPGSIRALGHLAFTGSSSGQGYLAQIHFKAVGQGGQISNLTLSNVKIFGPNGDSISSYSRSGQVEIMSSSTARVNLQLSPEYQNSPVGGNFTVAVLAQCGSLTPDGIDVFLDYDTAFLAVQSATAGTALSTILMAPTFDNTAGTFGFSAAQLNSPFPTGTFTVVTLVFQAKNVAITPVSISFHKAYSRITQVDIGGNNITGSLTGSMVNISSDVPLYLDPAFVGSIYSGQTFNLAIKTNTGNSRQVSGVQAYVNFNPFRLEVVDSDSAKSGIQITPGDSLNSVLENRVDNSSGLISYSAGQLGSPVPSGSFTVASIQFRAKGSTGNVTTPVTFSTSGATTTSLVEFGGVAISGVHADARVQILAKISVDISVQLQGSSRPNSGFAVPLTVSFFTPGTATPVDVMTATPVYTFNVIAAKNGVRAIVQAIMVNPGQYDISLASEHCLCNVKRGVVITATATAVDMGTLLEGDANGDHAVNIQDFGLLAGSYGKTGVGGANAMSDYDRNGIVNIADFGLLAGNYGKHCPVIVP
jgi:hypothetical protein